ncbi:hypothetical protein [Synechococcus sp. MW101C3]|uniref:hypothetical protein n=1 Tax=Synechococcus sp. MW101C3 TaxID=210768 RepID=UPI00118195D5|nr:hypothetical protein [Synechococcus sp. MW101C3]
MKTRLEPALGPAGAARLAERLLRRTIRTACASGLGVVELCTTPAPDHPAWRRLNLPAELAWSEQSPLADIDEPADLAFLPLGLRAHLETCHGHRFIPEPTGAPAPVRQGTARQPAGGDSGAQ